MVEKKSDDNDDWDWWLLICKKNLDFFKKIIIKIHKLHLFKSFKKI